MSGIFFDLPSPRFLRRFRLFGNMMRTFASSLLRWLIAPACGSRQVHFRPNEAEFPAASQSACKLFEWTQSDSRAVDGASIDALRLFDNWFNLKDQHELLFIWETLAPSAQRSPTQGQRPLAPSAQRNQSSKADILAAGSRIFFWKRQGCNENSNGGAQRHRAFATGAKT